MFDPVRRQKSPLEDFKIIIFCTERYARLVTTLHHRTNLVQLVFHICLLTCLTIWQQIINEIC